MCATWERGSPICGMVATVESVVERGDITPLGCWPVCLLIPRNAPCNSAQPPLVHRHQHLTVPDGSLFQHWVFPVGAVRHSRLVHRHQELGLDHRSALLTSEKNN